MVFFPIRQRVGVGVGVRTHNKSAQISFPLWFYFSALLSRVYHVFAFTFEAFSNLIAGHSIVDVTWTRKKILYPEGGGQFLKTREEKMRGRQNFDQQKGGTDPSRHYGHLLWNSVDMFIPWSHTEILCGNCEFFDFLSGCITQSVQKSWKIENKKSKKDFKTQ